MSSWHLTPSPYLFPDWPMAGLAALMTERPEGAVQVFAAIQVGALVGLVAWIDRVMHPDAAVRETWMRTSVAVAFALLLAYLNTDVSARGAQPGAPYVHLLQSAHHVGAVLVLLFLIRVSTRQVTQPPEGREMMIWAGAAGLVTLATAGSDPFLLPWAVAPLTVLLGLVGLVRKDLRRPAWILAGAIAVGAVAGHGLHMVLDTAPPDSPYRAPLKTELLSERWPQLKGLLGRIAWRHPVTTLLVVATQCMGLLGAYRLFTRRHGPLDPVEFGLAAVLLSGAAAAVVTLLMSLPVTSRYLLPTFALPVLLGPSLWWPWLRRTWAEQKILGWVLLLTLGGSWHVAWKHGLEVRRPAELRCIDKAIQEDGLKRGISGYWESKWLMARSDHRVVVAQFLWELKPYRHVTSDAFFDGPYTFVIRDVTPGTSDQIDPAKVAQAAGSLKRVHRCGRYQVHVFNQPIVLEGPVEGRGAGH